MNNLIKGELKVECVRRGGECIREDVYRRPDKEGNSEVCIFKRPRMEGLTSVKDTVRKK